MSSTQQQHLSMTGRKIARTAGVPTGKRFWLPLRLTRNGAGFAVMLVVLGFVAVNPGLNLLLLLFGMGVGLLLFNAILCGKQVWSVEARRVLPDVAAAGRPASICYEVTNNSGWTAARSLWILDRTSQGFSGAPVLVSYIEHVPPGGKAQVTQQIIPARRGLYQLGDLRLASKFPFGLVSRLRRVNAADQLLVWPALWNPRFDWLSRTPRGTQARASRGCTWQSGTDEFVGIREYRPGDNTRWIYWRRSASFDRVMVREMAQSSPGHVTLALETVTGGRPADPQTLDDLINAAASLACDAIERGWHVGLIASGQPRVVLPPAGGRAVRSRLLYELAILAPARTEPLAQLLDNWPGGPAWSGRAILLHPDREGRDPAIEAASARLRSEIGAVALLGPADLDRWFDRFTHTAGPTDVDASLAVVPPSGPAILKTMGSSTSVQGGQP